MTKHKQTICITTETFRVGDLLTFLDGDPTGDTPNSKNGPCDQFVVLGGYVNVLRLQSLIVICVIGSSGFTTELGFESGFDYEIRIYRNEH